MRGKRAQAGRNGHWIRIANLGGYDMDLDFADFEAEPREAIFCKASALSRSAYSCLQFHKLSHSSLRSS